MDYDNLHLLQSFAPDPKLWQGQSVAEFIVVLS